MAKRLSGQACYIDLEGGFWGICASGQNYFPINFPEQLKTKNKAVEISIELLEDVMTMQSWGVPCRIIAFSTIT